MSTQKKNFASDLQHAFALTSRELHKTTAVHEALIGILDVVPHFRFCQYEYHMERVCSQFSYTSGTNDSFDNILSVSVPNNSFIHFELQKAIDATILDSRETDMVCHGCNHETISEK